MAVPVRPARSYSARSQVIVSTPSTNVKFASEDVVSSLRGEDSSNTFPVLMWWLKKSPVRRSRSGRRSRAYLGVSDATPKEGEVGEISVTV